MNNILGLDLGINTGWAHYSKKECNTKYPIISGIIKFDSKNIGKRYQKFQNWIRLLLAQNNFHAVYYEGVTWHKGRFAAQAYGAFTAILAMECNDAIAVNPMHVKKFLTGKSRASKQEMVECVNKQANQQEHKIVNHNEADAIAILMYAKYLNQLC